MKRLPPHRFYPAKLRRYPREGEAGSLLLRVHNFRSIVDADIQLEPYGMLIGANNSGKSNVLDAIRVFYEKEKYSFERDFPKFETACKRSRNSPV